MSLEEQKICTINLIENW